MLGRTGFKSSQSCSGICKKEKTVLSHQALFFWMKIRILCFGSLINVVSNKESLTKHYLHLAANLLAFLRWRWQNWISRRQLLVFLKGSFKCNSACALPHCALYIASAGSPALLWPIELLQTALLSIAAANGIAARERPFQLHHLAWRTTAVHWTGELYTSMYTGATFHLNQAGIVCNKK